MVYHWVYVPAGWLRGIGISSGHAEPTSMGLYLTLA